MLELLVQKQYWYQYNHTWFFKKKHTDCKKNYIIHNIQNHRIVEQSVLGGTLKVIWFYLPSHVLGHLPLDQAAQKCLF